MRGEVAVSCWIPLTGRRGLYDCEVIIGIDSCLPPGASSVRFWVSMSRSKVTFTERVDDIPAREILQGRLGHEINDYPCELLALVFLEKMAGAFDHRVLLVFDAWNLLQKHFVTLG